MLPISQRPPRLTARAGVLLVFLVGTLLLLGAGMLATRALLTSSLYQASRQEAGREARLVANLGLAGALADGRLTRRDLRLAALDYAVAKHDLPLTGLVLWKPSGQVAFLVGTGAAPAARRAMPRFARTALADDHTQVAYASRPGPGPTVEAAVPLGASGLHTVAVFDFSRVGIERALNTAKTHLYLLIAGAALFMFLAILPLLAWAAKRVPLPSDAARRAALAEIKTALERRELVLHYQPKVALATETVVGVEALVRWAHPERGLLSPAEFLPLVESSPELLTALTCQVLDQAVGDCAAWSRDGRDLPVAVNVAAAVLVEGPLLRIVQDRLARHALPPRMLTLEITESTLMERRADVLTPLTQLREMGVSVSIDDFGTGHSSLVRLRALPFDELKVDRSFVAGIATDQRDLGIARHIVELGLDLGLQVVAEGVEDEATLHVLRTLGCSIAQGFYWSRALPDEELRQWLELPRTAEVPRASGPELPAPTTVLRQPD